MHLTSLHVDGDSNRHLKFDIYLEIILGLISLNDLNHFEVMLHQQFNNYKH